MVFSRKLKIPDPRYDLQFEFHAKAPYARKFRYFSAVVFGEVIVVETCIIK